MFALFGSCSSPRLLDANSTVDVIYASTYVILYTYVLMYVHDKQNLDFYCNQVSMMYELISR